MRVFILVGIPISLIFMCAIASQYAALIYINSYSQSFQDNLFQTQITFSRIFTQILSQQLNGEIQKYSEYIYMLNNYMSKIVNGKVVFKDPHKYTYMHMCTKYERKEDPELLALYYQHPLLTNTWYHQNITNISLLDDGGQQTMRNASRIYALQRAMEYENLQNLNSNKRKISFYDAFFGFQHDGLMTDSPINTTMVNFPTPGCEIGVYPYDLRCRFWYKQPLLYESQIFLPPGILHSSQIPYIASTACQKLYKYNATTQNKDILSVLCMDIQLIQIQNYFQNFVSSTKQFYLIEPRSQTILYNSNQYQNQYNLTLQYLNQIEFKYLISQSDAQLLNSTINSHYTSWVNETVPSISLKNSTLIRPQQIQVSYNRNGTQTTVILSPVVIYEKIPNYADYHHWVDQNSTNRYYIEIPYLQINILSDSDLKKQAQKVQSFFHNYFIAVSCVLGIGGIISFVITFIYSNRIGQMLSYSIERLTLILQLLNDQKLRDNIFDIDSEELLYSKETMDLYESFQGIYQILLFTSENFFSDNESNTLLRLSRNIEFFKKFGNIEAVGITLNNIGTILLSQQHYFQALEYFAESVIYAKYQIHQFCQRNQFSVSAHLLAEYSFDDKFYLQLQGNTNCASLNRCSEEQQSQFAGIRGSLSNERNYSNTSKLKTSSIKYSAQTLQPSTTIKSFKTGSIPTNQVDNTTATYQQSRNSNEFFISQLKKNIKDKKTFQYIKSKMKVFSQEVQLRFNQAKIGSEDLYEERIELLTNLYNRRRNYIITLSAYQENQDQILIQKKKQNHQDEHKASNQNYQITCNSYWIELKQILNEQLVLAKQLPFGDIHEIEICANISRCLYALGKTQKSNTVLQKCDQQLNVLLKKQGATNQALKVLESPLNLSSKNKTHLLPLQPIQNLQNQRSQNKKTSLNRNDEEHQINSNNDGLCSDQRGPISDSCRQSSEKMVLMKNNSNQNEQQVNISHFNHSFNDNSAIGLNSYQLQHSKNVFHPAICENESKEKFGNYSNKLQEEQDYQYEDQITRKTKKSTFQKKQQSKQLDKSIPSVLLSNYNFTDNNSKQRVSKSQSIFTRSKAALTALTALTRDEKGKRVDQEGEKDLLTLQRQQGKTKELYGLQKYGGLEELFRNQRQAEDLIKNQLSHYTNYSINIQDFVFCLQKALLLFREEKYRSAAEVLTCLLEQKKQIASHYPFKIFYMIKLIFEKANIPCKEIDTIMKKFNPNLSLQVTMIVQCSQTHRQLVKRLQFVSDLVSTTLVNRQDKLGISLIDQTDKNIYSYMPLTQVTQIKSSMNQIINDILSIGQRKTSQTIITDGLNRTEDSEEILEHHEDQNNNKPLRQHESEKPLNVFLKNDSGFESQDQSNVHNQQNISRQNPSRYGFLQDNEDSYAQRINEEKESQINSNNGLIVSFNKDSSPLKQLEFPYLLKQQFSNNMHKMEGDDDAFQQNMIFSSANLEHTFQPHVIKQQLLEEEEEWNNSAERNKYFHLCLRKTLSQLFQFNYSLYREHRQNELNQQCAQKNYSQENNQKEQQKQKCTPKQIDPISYNQRKFIIILTDKISLSKNRLFQQLCLCLFNLDVELIFLCFEKGNNFLEETQDHTFSYEDKDIIRVFYSNNKLLSYLQNQRDKTCKFQYATTIQHF